MEFGKEGDPPGKGSEGVGFVGFAGFF